MTSRSEYDMSQKKRILYVQTSGVDTPERTYAPFILATTAAMMNIEATIYFLIKGVTVVKKGEAEKIKIGSFPSLKEVIDQATRAGVRLQVCEQSTQLLGLSRGDFMPEAEVVGAATLNDLTLDADAILCF
jgi:predicted peroxiredoxin